jgi:hypothetical protein
MNVNHLFVHICGTVESRISKSFNSYRQESHGRRRASRRKAGRRQPVGTVQSGKRACSTVVHYKQLFNSGCCIVWKLRGIGLP